MNQKLTCLYIDMLKRNGMITQTSSQGNSFWLVIDADEIQSGCFLRTTTKYYKLENINSAEISIYSQKYNET